MAKFKLEVCSASCSHSTRYGTVIADCRTHLDEQTLASGGYALVGIEEIKDGRGQDLVCRSATLVTTKTLTQSYKLVISFQLTEMSGLH